MEFENLKEELFRFLDKNPFIHSLGIHYTTIEKGHVVAEMTPADTFTNPAGVCHGGIVYSFADTVVGVTSFLHGRKSVTSSGNLNYIRPVPIGSPVICEVNAVKEGRSLAVYRAEIKRPDGKICAVGDFTYFITEEKLL